MVGIHTICQMGKLPPVIGRSEKADGAKAWFAEFRTLWSADDPVFLQG
jgi:hypothetical protein